MNITKASEQHRTQVLHLLDDNKLPISDLSGTLSGFYVASDKNEVVGVIGLENYGDFGLLRSMVVHPDFRNQNVAGELVGLLERDATDSGLKGIYLLTETAERYFERKGYQVVAKSDVPGEITSSSEFSHVCPSSAIVMMKRLATP